MCGVTRKDKIRNKHIRGTMKVVQASRKITERRLKWYGQVMRMEEDHVYPRHTGGAVSLRCLHGINRSGTAIVAVVPQRHRHDRSGSVIYRRSIA